MLTPMLVQYLVGLCCLRRNPEAVDVTVGDLVMDTAAKKRRDVDITVTLTEADGTVRAFKAYEVKREGQPLDVTTVEQLCSKLEDMPTVTHRAIVSASDFTDGAIAKAGAHNVELFVLKPWTQPLSHQFPQFTNAGRPDEFFRNFESNLLYWVESRLTLLAPDGSPSFNYDGATPTFSADGSTHKTFASMSEFTHALLCRSTGILWPLEPAQTISRTFPAEPVADNEEFMATPAWPHTHTLGVVDDQVFLKFDTGLAVINSVTISGRLQWRKRKRPREFHMLERVPTGEAFAGAALADWGSPDDKIFAMIFSPDSRDVGIHTIQLQEKHKNAIRQLKIPLPATPPKRQPSRMDAVYRAGMLAFPRVEIVGTGPATDPWTLASVKAEGKGQICRLPSFLCLVVTRPPRKRRGAYPQPRHSAQGFPPWGWRVGRFRASRAPSGPCR